MEQRNNMEATDEFDVIIVCKKCKATFLSTSILRHLRKKECKQAYTEQELDDLKSDSKDRAFKKRKIWKQDNKEHVSQQNSNYYNAHKAELSQKDAKRYLDGKMNKELQWKYWDWLHSNNWYYDRKKEALAQYDKFIWSQNGKWAKEISRFKNSKLITEEKALYLNNLQHELDSKMKDLHDIKVKVVRDIEEEVKLPENRVFENFDNDMEFQCKIFDKFRQYINFKRRHIYYFAHDQLKEIAISLQETLDPWIEKYWASDRKDRDQILKMVEIDEKEQLIINEEYFQEIKEGMFNIHRNGNGKTKAECWREYDKLRLPPSYLFLSPMKMYPEKIEECRNLGLIV